MGSDNWKEIREQMSKLEATEDGRKKLTEIETTLSDDHKFVFQGFRKALFQLEGLDRRSPQRRFDDFTKNNPERWEQMKKELGLDG